MVSARVSVWKRRYELCFYITKVPTRQNQATKAKEPRLILSTTFSCATMCIFRPSPVQCVLVISLFIPNRARALLFYIYYRVFQRTALQFYL